MQTAKGKRMDLSAPLDQYLSCESRISATFSAQAFKAVEKKSRNSVGLWISRAPLSVEEELRFVTHAAEFLDRVSSFNSASYGLDTNRHGFIVFSLPTGRHISEGAPEGSELERRYLGCIRAIEVMHNRGLCCGDISLESFLLGREGEVLFIAGLGLLSDPEELLKQGRDELLELRAYQAPEQRVGGQEGAKVDVYALAALGYRLFSGAPLIQAGLGIQPGNEQEIVQILGAPAWINLLIPSILNSPLDSRPGSASELMKAIVKAREISLKSAQKAGWASRDTKNARFTIGGARVLDGAPRAVPRRAIDRVALFAIGCLSIVALLGFGFSKVSEYAGLNKSNGSLRGIQSVSDLPPAFTEKIGASVLSDDPFAHETLIKALKEAEDDSQRSAITHGILSRSRRLGLLRSTDLMRNWLQESRIRADNLLFIKLLNPALPGKTRLELLRNAYAEERQETVQLAAALGLDLGEPEALREIFMMAAKELAGFMDHEQHGVLAILIAMPQVRTLYLADILELKDQISSVDILWVLDKFVQQHESELRTIAALTIAKGAVSGPQVVFVEVLRNGVGLSQRERSALVSAAQGKISRATVSTLAVSYTAEAPKALLATIILADDSEVQRSAYEALTAKPINDPYLRAVRDSIRDRAQRERYGQLVATIGLSNYLSDEQFTKGLEVLKSGPLDQGLITVLLQHGPARVVFEVITQLGDRLESGVFLDLLRHPSKEVRIEALQRLVGNNNIIAIKLIKQYYEEELDLDVRAQYERTLAQN